MERIVLDTNILLRFPEIISQKIEGVVLVVPMAVLAELSTFRRGSHNRDELVQSIRVGEKKHNVVVIDVMSEDFPLPESPRLSYSDVKLLMTADHLKKVEGSASVASDDKVLISVAHDLGLKTYTLEQLKARLKLSAIRDDAEIKSLVSAMQERLRKSLVRSIVISVFSALFGAAVSRFAGEIVEYLPFGVTVAGLLVFSSVLFWIRAWYRLFYGIIEFAAGLTFGYQAIFPNPSLTATFSALTALYVMVRGLDNIGRGLDPAGKPYQVWKKLFGDAG